MPEHKFIHLQKSKICRSTAGVTVLESQPCERCNITTRLQARRPESQSFIQAKADNFLFLNNLQVVSGVDLFSYLPGTGYFFAVRNATKGQKCSHLECVELYLLFSTRLYNFASLTFQCRASVQCMDILFFTAFRPRCTVRS